MSVYEAKDGFRWCLVANNGNIMAESGEAYTREPDAYKAAVRVVSIIRGRFVLDRRSIRERMWISVDEA